MKLVELLAQVVSEWPVGAKYAVQDGDSRQTVKFGKTKGNLGIKSEGHELDVWQNHSWGFTSDHDFDHDELATDFLTSIVTRAQWQAERDRQKGGEWKRHRAGRNQPVMAGVRVEVKLRCGDIQQGNAHEFIWLHSECDVAANIMSYRVISQPQAEEVEKEVFVGKDVKLEYAFSEEGVALEDLDWKPIDGKLTSVECVDPALFGTVEDAQPRDTLSAYKEFTVTGQWDQVETPFKWRDEVTELNAYIEKYTRERDALIDRLAREGFALIPAMNAVMGVANVDMQDWRNWKEGDIVEVVIKNDCDLPIGKQYPVSQIEKPGYEGGMPVMIKDEDGCEYWAEDSEYDLRPVFKFIRRP